MSRGGRVLLTIRYANTSEPRIGIRNKNTIGGGDHFLIADADTDRTTRFVYLSMYIPINIRSYEYLAHDAGFRPTREARR